MIRNMNVWLVAVLAAALVAGLVLVSHRRTSETARTLPSTYNAAPQGMRALHDLFAAQGMRAQRFKRPFTQLPDDASLLIIVEPISQRISPDEADALKAWVRKGNTLLLVVSASEPSVRQELNIEEADAAEFAERSEEISAEPVPSAYLRDVRRLWVSGTTRLLPDATKTSEVLARDKDGAYVMTWRNGSGTCVVLSESIGHRNGAIGRADNAVLFVNIAERHGGRQGILFDEFHHGYQEVAPKNLSLWGALSLNLKIVALYLLLLFVAFVYNANVRFGPPLSLQPPSARPSTEYIESMAGLYRRAQATGIALEQHYSAFTRDLARRLGMPPDSVPERLAELAASELGLPREEIGDLLTRCRDALSQARIGETEMTSLIGKLQHYRRSADLDRLR